MEEVQIIKYCKAGNSRGFKELVDRYAPKLYGICLRYMGDEFEAKDVLQESFIKIFKNISKYEQTGSFEGWMSKIAVNSSLMALRKNKNHIAYLEPIQETIDAYDTEIEDKLNENDIVEMIKKLPNHYRTIFNLAIIEGYKHSEIASLLNITESTSRTKLTRARKKMQDIYLKEMNLSPIQKTQNRIRLKKRHNET